MADTLRVVISDPDIDLSAKLNSAGDLVVSLDGEDIATGGSLYTKAYDYDADGQVIYKGWAAPGSAKSGAVWRIKKLTWSSGNLTDEQWADANNNFDNVWNNRASLSYS